MKSWNWGSFIAGIVAGSLLTIVVSVVINNQMLANYDGKGIIPGLTMLKEGEQGSSFNTSSLQVMQTLSPKLALAHIGKESKYSHEVSYTGGILVLYIASDEVRLYDDQIIEIPQGKTLVQIGTYEYGSNLGRRTVPAVSIK